MHSHECLVVAANLLQMNIELGVDIRFQYTIALRFGSRGADEQTSRILQSALVLEPSGCGSAMTMTGFQHARILLPGELYRVGNPNIHI